MSGRTKRRALVICDIANLLAKRRLVMKMTVLAMVVLVLAAIQIAAAGLLADMVDKRTPRF